MPRKGIKRNTDIDWYLQKPHIFLNGETDISNLSSTEIRDKLKGYNKLPPEEQAFKLNNLINELDENVIKYILKNKLYE